MSGRVDKLLDEKIVLCDFVFPVFIKFKVKTKELIAKHNKEIGWRLSQEPTRSKDGERMISFKLAGKETLIDVPEKRSMLTGMVEDIYQSLGVLISEESEEAHNKILSGIATGRELKFLNVNLDDDKTYIYLHYLDSLFYMFSDVNKIIEIERDYPDVVKKAYGITIQSWYEESVATLKKFFVWKRDLENAKVIVDLLEMSSSVERIPYKLNKFRIAL